MLRAEPAPVSGPVRTHCRVLARDSAVLDLSDPSKVKHRDWFGSSKQGHWPCSTNRSSPVQVITLSLISLFRICEKLSLQPEGSIPQRGGSLPAHALPRSALAFLGFSISSATGLTGRRRQAENWKDQFQQGTWKKPSQFCGLGF